MSHSFPLSLNGIPTLQYSSIMGLSMPFRVCIRLHTRLYFLSLRFCIIITSCHRTGSTSVIVLYSPFTIIQSCKVTLLIYGACSGSGRYPAFPTTTLHVIYPGTSSWIQSCLFKIRVVVQRQGVQRQQSHLGPELEGAQRPFYYIKRQQYNGTRWEEALLQTLNLGPGPSSCSSGLNILNCKTITGSQGNL